MEVEKVKVKVGVVGEIRILEVVRLVVRVMVKAADVGMAKTGEDNNVN